MAEGAGIARSGPCAGARATDAPRVLVVYGLKTDDYGWLAGFYPARRLAEACENRGIPLRFLFPGDVPAYLAGSHTGAGLPAGERTVACERTVALVRGDVGEETYELLESAGYRCVNDWRSSSLARDKLTTFRFLADHGWPTPETWPMDEALRLAGGARNAGGAGGAGGAGDACAFPLVVKPRFGSRGEGVALAHDANELATLANVADRDAGGAGTCAGTEFVAQEYVGSSRGRDVRVFFAGGDAIAVAERTNDAGTILSNACAGGATRLITDGSFARQEAMTLDIAREAGLWYGTVDWLYLPDGNMTVCEINSTPGFEALETSCDVDIAGAIVDRLTRLAR